MLSKHSVQTVPKVGAHLGREDPEGTKFLVAEEHEPDEQGPETSSIQKDAGMA